MLTVLAGVIAFTSVMLGLVVVLMWARSRLVPSGLRMVVINGGSEHDFRASTGGTLLAALTERGMLVPAACGGQGTCGACRVLVEGGAGAMLATETVHLSPAEVREGWRLSCQVKVRDNLRIALPLETFSRGRWLCTVKTCRNVSTFIRELVLELPRNESVEFRAGAYVQVECPPHTLRYADFDIDERYRADWERFNLFQLESVSKRAETRAYSLANYPDERGIFMLNVRIATPPPGLTNIPPGIVSSYLFSLAPGDRVHVNGPFGDFGAKDTSKEMIFVGGGAGMAPMRSHVLDQLMRLRSSRKISFWYGARSLREAFYIEELDRLVAEHKNFEWHLVLSEPLTEDQWEGRTGFVHQVVFDTYLKDHPAPDEVEYYLCGPPMMIRACRSMLYDLGVESDNIMFDEFS